MEAKKNSKLRELLAALHQELAAAKVRDSKIQELTAQIEQLRGILERKRGRPRKDGKTRTPKEVKKDGIKPAAEAEQPRKSWLSGLDGI